MDEFSRVIERLGGMEDTRQVFAGVVTRAPIGFQVCAADGTSLYVNEGFRKLFGFEPPAGYNVLRDPILAQRGYEPFVRRAFAGETVSVRALSHMVLQVDGNRRPTEERVAVIDTKFFPLVDATGVARQVGVCFHEGLPPVEGSPLQAEGPQEGAIDLQGHGALQEKLQASEATFREIFENGSDGMMLTDPSAGRLVDANSRASELTGYTKHELMVIDPRKMVLDEPGFRLVDMERLIDKALAGEPQVFEWKGRHKSGRPYWVESTMRLANIRGEQRLLCSQRDIRDRKRLQEALQRTQRQLLQSQKMEAVGRLAGGIAHDFNNLLSVVLGYSELTLSMTEAGTETASSIEEIHKAGLRAAKLTAQLLAFSRQQLLETKVVDLNEVVQGTMSILERLLGDKVQLLTVLAPDLAMTRVDPGQMEQVVINLCVNARDAMPNGGLLRIETSNTMSTSATRTDSGQAANEAYVLLTVTDRGIGIPAQHHAEIFEPFFTTKNSAQGTGLGLATVLGIVQQSGGHITVESAPDEGTTFRVFIPQTHDPRAPQRSVSVRPRVAPNGKETILLAEDEPQVRVLVEAILSGAGYKVLTARTPTEVLTCSRDFDGAIHALVTDVVMPGMNGRALAEAVLGSRPETKVLFMSGYSDVIFDDADIHRNSWTFLHKPITPDSLLRKLQELLGHAEQGVGGGGGTDSGVS